MDERSTSKRKGSGLLWLLVLVAVLLVWWYWRPDANRAVAASDDAADRYADPDDILVDMVDDVDADAIAAIERELNIELVLVSDQSFDERFYRAHVEPQRRDAVLAALSKSGLVEIAEPDATVSLWPSETFRAPAVHDGSGYPNDPLYKHQWHLDQIRMPAAWKLADGNGVIVAVLDTGVAFQTRERFHRVEDLNGVSFVKPFNFVNNDTFAEDDHGHGTHVAGTIAQVTNNGIGVAGVARNVKIMPLKVLSGSGSGSVGGIADAIRYAADEGAKVINMSLGGRFPSRVLKKAVEYAHSKGVTVVCAAGNESRGKVGYPAAYPGAVAVSATQFDEATTFYSNYGVDIDIAAPGGNTRIDQNGDGMPDGVLQNTIAIQDPSKSDYFGFMGTSMASPHAAGVAALVVGEGITDPDAVERILKSTARKPDRQRWDPERYGAGIIDAEAAVLAARSSQGGWQLLLGLLLAGGVASSVRRRGLGVRLGPSYLGGVMLGASGLFFLPWLAAGMSSLPGIAMLTHGLPSWDLAVLGGQGHGNALFFSALLPLGLLVLGAGVSRLRAPLAGLAVGVAGHLVFHLAARVTDIQYVPGVGLLDALWLAMNALVCVGAAMLVLRR